MTLNILKTYKILILVTIQKRRNMGIKKSVLGLIIVLLIVIFLYDNKRITISRVELENTKVKKDIVITQISDLHNTQFGKNQKNIIKKVKEASPDIVVITGDVIDQNHTDIDVALQLVSEIVKIAPTYYVTGNHEAASEEFEVLNGGMQNAGVKVLSNESLYLEEYNIYLYGVEDPTFMIEDYFFQTEENVMIETLDTFDFDLDCYNILLSHRPEFFEEYCQYNINLILSGHAHGGQIRIPGVGGVVAPGQGIFPKYTEGVYKDANTSMIVSRGLGNSIIPLRINNNPELVQIVISGE